MWEGSKAVEAVCCHNQSLEVSKTNHEHLLSKSVEHHEELYRTSLNY